jgi:hypothetical protein
VFADDILFTRAGRELVDAIVARVLADRHDLQRLVGRDAVETTVDVVVEDHADHLRRPKSIDPMS